MHGSRAATLRPSRGVRAASPYPSGSQVCCDGSTDSVGRALASLIAGIGWLSVGAGSAGADDRRFDGWGRPVASMAQAQQQAGTDQAITLIGKELRGAGVDVGANGNSAGDMFFFEERLYNRSQTEVVGKSSVRCQAGVRTSICDGTLRLEGRGKIVVGSAFFAQRDSTVAVTGGTHRFKGVGGAMQIFNLSGDKSLYIIKLIR